MMKIAIIGYGKMGKAIEEVAESKGHKIMATIDSDADWKKKFQQLKFADVAIEFSTPFTVVSNIIKCFHLDIPVVVGTTAWEEHFEEVKEICIKKGQALFAASNFSLGVNVFFKINQHLAAFMNKLPQYQIEVDETHHAQKVDKPSGTARQLANDLIKRVERKNTWVLDTEARANEIRVTSQRLGDVPGIHEVKYTSAEDIIQIKHTAISRKGFAQGAVMAAEWMIGKKGVFSMDDMLAEVI